MGSEIDISPRMISVSGSEVIGSTPAGPTTRRTGPVSAKIFKTSWQLKKSGYSEDTLKAKGHRLRYLARHTNLDDPEAVRGCIANQSRWSNAYKQGVAYAYNSYAKANGLEWTLLHFRMPPSCLLSLLVGRYALETPQINLLPFSVSTTSHRTHNI